MHGCGVYNVHMISIISVIGILVNLETFSLAPLHCIDKGNHSLTLNIIPTLTLALTNPDPKHNLKSNPN